MADVTLPHELANGATADADQVMANFDAIVAALNALDLENLSSTLRSFLHEPGDIKITGLAAAPTGWLMCDGSAVSRSTYAALFAAIGTAFGEGDGSTTFNVPELRGRVPVGKNVNDPDFDALGESGGEKAHTLTEAEMPSHTHTYSQVTGGTGISGGVDPAWGGAITTTGATGGGGPHNNVQPYVVVNFVIKT